MGQHAHLMDMALTLEISAGCPFSCTGCTIQKDGSSMPTESDFDRLDALVAEMKAQGVRTGDFTLGPTDLMSSFNREEILTSERIRSLGRNFLNPNVNTSLLRRKEDEYIRFGQHLNAMFHGGNVSISVPFEVSQIENRKYLEVLRTRIQLIESQLTDVVIDYVYPIVNVQSVIEYDKKNKTSITERMMLQALDIELHERTHMDFVLPHGRIGLNNIDNLDGLVETIDLINSIHRNIMLEPEYEGHPIGINTLHPNEGKLWDVVYNRGELYLIPFIIDGFPIFDEEYRLKGEWTFEAIYEHSNNKYYQDLEYATQVKDCSDCEFMADCAARGVVGIIKKSKVDRCLSVIKHLRKDFMWDASHAPIDS